MKEHLYDTPANIIAGITLRDINLPLEGSMALHTGQKKVEVIQNRKLFAAQHGIRLNQLVFANQTHSINTAIVKKSDAGRGTLSIADAFQETDALITFENDIMLTCLTADCVPVLFWSVQSHLIGAIHSGWRGTVAEITVKTFNLIKENYPDIDFNTIHVQLGPALTQYNFEVDKDVAQQFEDLGYAEKWIKHSPGTQKYYIDNQAVIAEQCRRSGIDVMNIIINPTCTMEDELGFSYRESKTAGRHVNFIAQTSDQNSNSDQ